MTIGVAPLIRPYGVEVEAVFSSGSSSPSFLVFVSTTYFLLAQIVLYCVT